jgi:hypothetical protein
VDNYTSDAFTFLAAWPAIPRYKEMSFQSIDRYSYTFTAEPMDTFCFLMAQKVKVKKKTLFH